MSGRQGKGRDAARADTQPAATEGLYHNLDVARHEKHGGLPAVVVGVVRPQRVQADFISGSNWGRNLRGTGAFRHRGRVLVGGVLVLFGPFRRCKHTPDLARQLAVGLDLEAAPEGKLLLVGVGIRARCIAINRSSPSTKGRGGGSGRASAIDTHIHKIHEAEFIDPNGSALTGGTSW